MTGGDVYTVAGNYNGTLHSLSVKIKLGPVLLSFMSRTPIRPAWSLHAE
jgi:hypothetical protein